MNKQLADFESGKLDPEAFDHAMHIECAWRCLDAYGSKAGRRRFRAALKRLTEKFGQPGKYHATITDFYLDLIDARRDSADTDFDVFRSRNADLFKGSRSVLLLHYSAETLNSDAARTRYLPPEHGA